jgi:hypothetical protein
MLLDVSSQCHSVQRGGPCRVGSMAILFRIQPCFLRNNLACAGNLSPQKQIKEPRFSGTSTGISWCTQSPRRCVASPTADASCPQVRSTNSMEVLEWQAVSVQHLVCPVAQRIDVECTGTHTAFLVPHTLPPMCTPSATCPEHCPSSANPFPQNTTIINGDVYSHPTSHASTPQPSLFAAVFDCPEGVHTLAGVHMFPPAHRSFALLTPVCQHTSEPKYKARCAVSYVVWRAVTGCLSLE